MKIKFIPQNEVVDLDPNKSVMQIAHENNLPVKSVCNGLPSCAECRVQISEGEHNVLPPTAEELALIGTGYFIDHRRLSCQLKCYGDVVIDLSEQVEKEKQQGHRRPQGNLKKESTEQSLAVTGNLLDADEELLKDSELEVREDSVKVDNQEGVNFSGRGHTKRKNSGGSKKSHKNKRRGAVKASGGSSQAEKEKSKASSGPSNSSGKKRPSRHRNRNKNRQKSNKSSGNE